jgi:hypothetical protein
MPIKVLKKYENKTIPVSHSKDHPDVKTTEKIIKKDREKAKEDFPILSKVFGTGNPKKDTEKAKRVADTLQTMASKMRTKTEGSFKKGGLSAGQKKIAAKAPPPNKIDAKDFAVLKAEKAKGRGMGLQDEKIKPGKVMKAKTGKQIVKEFSASLKGIDESFKDKVHPMKKQRLMDRNKVMTKAKYGKAIKTELKADPTKPISSVAPKASDILKKKKLPGRIGTALGIASMMVPAAYAAAIQYKDYKAAKNRDEAKVKKMVGGMAKKYSVGGGADMGAKSDFDKITERTKTYAKAESMKDRDRLTTRDIQEATKALKPSQRKSRRYAATPGYLPKPAIGKMGGGMMNKPMGYSSGSKLMDFIKSGSYTDKYGTKTNVDKAIKKINLSPKDKDLATMKPASDKKMMGGGMMQRPMGYKSGTMVKARGCKLGRTRPTKMY